MTSISLNSIFKIFFSAQTQWNTEEEKLVTAIIQENRNAQESFYKIYFPKMFPIALRYGTSKEDAHEIINTAFLKVLDTVKNYKTDNFNAWVSTIVKRTAIDYYRKYLKNEIETTSHLEIDSVEYNTALSTLQIEDLITFLQKIPVTSRMVFNMFVFEEMTHKEIAKQLNISEGTSKWHVSNARKQLLEKLNKELV